MRKAKARAVIVDGVSYVWTVKHEHHVLPLETAGGRCREVFTAYRAGVKRSPVRVAFSGGPDRFAGDPDKGIVWTRTEDGEVKSANLSTPGVAASLIRLARGRGWDPENARSPLVIDDGFELLVLAAPRGGSVSLRGAAVIARRALATVPPRPRYFVDDAAKQEWSDEPARVVDEALAWVDEIAERTELDDDARRRGAAILVRLEAFEEAIGAAADAYDYDLGACSAGTVTALVAAALGEAEIALVVHMAARVIPCAEEAAGDDHERRLVLRKRALQRFLDAFAREFPPR